LSVPIIEGRFIENIFKVNGGKIILFFFLFSCGTSGTAASTGLLYQPRMIRDGDCGEIGGMKIGRQGKPKYSEKTCPSATFVHHKIPYNQTRV
jgi:hypothetical protein